MEPHPPAARARWLKGSAESVARDVTSIQAQFQVLVLQQPPLDGADQELADTLVQQLDLLERECALVQAQLSHLIRRGADLHGESASGPSPSSDTPEARGTQGTLDDP